MVETQIKKLNPKYILMVVLMSTFSQINTYLVGDCTLQLYYWCFKSTAYQLNCLCSIMCYC